MYYLYAINEDTPTPAFMINTHIGYDSEDGYGVMGPAFKKEVADIVKNKPKKLLFYINSLGGKVQDALDIFEAIQNAGVPTEAIVHGFAYSCAGWIPFAADKITMMEHSMWMCHMPFIQDGPSVQDKFLQSVAESISTIISDRSGRNGKEKLTTDEVMHMMKEKTFMNGEKCYKTGLCDKLESASGKKIAVTNHENEVELYHEYQGILNQYKENRPAMDFKNLRNKLNLSEGSGEDDYMQAIARIENRAKAVKDEADELRRQLDAANNAKNEITSARDAFQIEANSNKQALEAANAEKLSLTEKLTSIETEKTALQNKVSEFETKNKEAEAAALKDRSKALVNGFVEQGKIKNEEELVNGWIEAASESEKAFNQVKLQFESMNVNMVLPTPMLVNKAEETKEAKEGSTEWYRQHNRDRRTKGREAVINAMKASGMDVSKM